MQYNASLTGSAAIRNEQTMASKKQKGISEPMKMKEPSAYKQQKQRAEKFQEAFERQAQTTMLLTEKLKECEGALNDAGMAYKDAQDAWTIEHELRTKAQEHVAKLEGEVLDKKDKVIIQFNSATIIQKLNEGDEFTFEHDNDANITGSYSVRYTPLGG